VTATDELVDLDVDLEQPVVCALPNCDHEATLIAVNTCCGKRGRPACREHARRVDWVFPTFTSTYCGGCKTSPFTYQWRPL